MEEKRGGNNNNNKKRMEARGSLLAPRGNPLNPGRGRRWVGVQRLGGWGCGGQGAARGNSVVSEGTTPPVGELEENSKM